MMITASCSRSDTRMLRPKTGSALRSTLTISVGICKPYSIALRRSDEHSGRLPRSASSFQRGRIEVHARESFQLEWLAPLFHPSSI